MHRRIGSTTAVVAAAVAVAVITGGFATGCSRSTDASATPETTASSPPDTTVAADTTSTSAMTEVEAILAAVSKYWDVYLAASNPPDPNHPAIDEVMTGDARDRLAQLLEDRKALGQEVRLPNPTQFGLYPTITKIAENSATVSVCLVDDTQLVAMETGEILDDEIETYLFVLDLDYSDAVWKISQNTVNEAWEGRAGCAPADH